MSAAPPARPDTLIAYGTSGLVVAISCAWPEEVAEGFIRAHQALGHRLERLDFEAARARFQPRGGVDEVDAQPRQSRPPAPATPPSTASPPGPDPPPEPAPPVHPCWRPPRIGEVIWAPLKAGPGRAVVTNCFEIGGRCRVLWWNVHDRKDDGAGYSDLVQLLEAPPVETPPALPDPPPWVELAEPENPRPAPAGGQVLVALLPDLLARARTTGRPERRTLSHGLELLAHHDERGPYLGLHRESRAVGQEEISIVERDLGWPDARREERPDRRGGHPWVILRPRRAPTRREAEEAEHARQQEADEQERQQLLSRVLAARPNALFTPGMHEVRRAALRALSLADLREEAAHLDRHPFLECPRRCWETSEPCPNAPRPPATAIVAPHTLP